MLWDLLRFIAAASKGSRNLLKHIFNRNKKPLIGDFGESIACGYLKRNGYQIICINWQNPAGELDIVALHNNQLVFIEVKSQSGKSNNIDLAARRLNPRKMRKVIQLAKKFTERHLNKRVRNRFTIRFDGIVIHLKINSANSRYFLYHYKDIWKHPVL